MTSCLSLFPYITILYYVFSSLKSHEINLLKSLCDPAGTFTCSESKMETPEDKCVKSVQIQWQI